MEVAFCESNYALLQELQRTAKIMEIDLWPIRISDSHLDQYEKEIYYRNKDAILKGYLSKEDIRRIRIRIQKGLSGNEDWLVR